MSPSQTSMVHRGDVWLTRLSPVEGAEMDKTRPAVVVSADGMGVLPVRLVAPCTTATLPPAPWRVPVTASASNGLDRDTTIDLMQMLHDVRLKSDAKPEAQWRLRLSIVRTGSSADLLLRALPGTPVLSVRGAMVLLGRSKPQVNGAVARLEQAGALRQVSVGRRNRVFEATEAIDAFADLERQLAISHSSAFAKEYAI